MKSYFILIFTLFLFSSCAFHSGIMTGNAAITNANFKYVGLVKGEAKTTHILGIGGLNKRALVFDAKKDLLTNYPLLEGQALANVIVDFKRTYAFFVIITDVIVTADVVDFNIEETIPKFDSMIVNSHFSGTNNRFGLQLNDSVYFINEGNVEKGQIISFGTSTSKIKYQVGAINFFFNVSKNEEVLLKSPSEIFVADVGYNTNEKIEFINENGKILEGIIFGINTSSVGIKYNFQPEGTFFWKVIPIGRIQKLR